MSASVSRDELGGLLAPVRARLAALARRERWGRTALGVGSWLAMMSLALLVCTLVDNQLDRANPLDGTPVWARMAMRAILVGLAGWLAWLRTGQAFTLDLDETGRSHPGRITRLGAQIDPISQTLTVYGALTGTPAGLVAGMSGAARFPRP